MTDQPLVPLAVSELAAQCPELREYILEQAAEIKRLRERLLLCEEAANQLYSGDERRWETICAYYRKSREEFGEEQAAEQGSDEKQ